MDTEFGRQQMVEQQVRAWDVLDPDVLRVLKDIPRELFVPEGFEPLAFADTVIPIGRGQSMMTPTIEGRVLQALAPEPGNRVLEIGTGTGFLAACLAKLSGNVTSIDIFEEFTRSAGINLDRAGADGVTLYTMDGTRELPEGTFDVIAVTGSIETFDPRFAEALNPGGRLFVVVGKRPAMDARLVTRTADHQLEIQSLFENVLTPLVNGTEPPRFSF
jgi:protein-L-isoaspartate(D-aspartate) O-methyltransferase